MSSDETTVDDAEITTSGAGSIHVNNLAKEFTSQGGIVPVFDDLNFEIESGSFVALLGKSGAGKSTLMNIISGFMEPTSGSVEFKTADGTGEVTLGHVFQDPRLLPWDTARQNIEYVHENNPDYSSDVAEKYLDLVGLAGHYDSYPSQLSGGQQQRVGIARALSIDPEILLMDEPFSTLDEITAEELREELINIWQQLGKTVFFVTHDITEAIEMSDRILMLGDGRIYQDIEVTLDRPRDVDTEEFLKFRQDAIERFRSIE